jgi:hypothetical protein
MNANTSAARPLLRPPVSAAAQWRARTPVLQKIIAQMETGMSRALATCVNPLRFEPRIKILHLAWLTFFVSVIEWFNQAPLMEAM